MALSAAACAPPAAQLRDVALRLRSAGRCGPSGAALLRCPPRGAGLAPRTAAPQTRAGSDPEGMKASLPRPQSELPSPPKGMLPHIGTGVAALALVLSLAAPLSAAAAAPGVVPPAGNEDVLLEEGAQTTGSSGAPGVGQGIKEPLRGVGAELEARASDGAKKAKDTVRSMRQAPGAKAAEAIKSEASKLAKDNKGVVEGVKGKVNEITGDVQGKAGEAAKALKNPFGK